LLKSDVVADRRAAWTKIKNSKMYKRNKGSRLFDLLEKGNSVATLA